MQRYLNKKSYKKKKKNGSKVTSNSSSREIAKKALVIAKDLRNQIETKYLDYILPIGNNVTITNVPLRYSTFIDLGQGSSIAQRIGYEVKLVRLRVKCVIYVTDSTMDDDFVRIALILYQGSTNDGAVPVWNDLFTIDSGTGTADTQLSFYSSELVGDYKILHDRVYSVNVSSIGSRHVDINVPLDVKANYQAGSNFSSNVNIVMFVVGTLQGGNPRPSFYYHSRTYFQDM